MINANQITVANFQKQTTQEGSQLQNANKSGSILGTHYDHQSVIANRAKSKRPVPVHSTILSNNQVTTKIGGQPTQSKKGA